MQNKIYYADCLPGFGKTFWSINKMCCLYQAKDSVVIYSAPTHRLLKEVYEKLIQHDVKATDIFYIDESVSASSKLHEILTGGLPGKNTKKDIPEVFPGSIILTTHANLWNCHASPMFLRTQFPTKKDITLIIDEARNCEIRTTKFTLKGEDVINSFISILGIRNVAFYSKYRPINITRSVIQQISQKLGDDIAQKLISIRPEQLSDSRLNSLYMYVSMFSNSKGTVTIQCVMTPYQLLIGWKNMFVLSAMFKTSQFYHLISLCDKTTKLSDDQQSLVGDCPPVELIDISQQVADKKRCEIMKARFEQVTFGYLLDNGMSKDKINGYIVRSNKIKYVTNYATKLKDLFKTASHISLNNLHDLMTQSISKNKQQYSAIQECRKNILKYTVRVRNKETDTITPINAITWLGKIADNISKDWINNPSHYCRIPKKGNYLLSINKTASRTSYYDKKQSLFKQVIPSSIGALDISGDVRGLDCYKDYDVVAFFASIRLTPALKMWFKQFCPNYDPELDTMLGTALQTICRCSIRDGKSISKPLVLVTGETCALGLIALLEQYFKGYGNKVELLSPANFGINSYSIISNINTDKEQKEISRQRLRTYARLESTKQKRKEYEAQVKTRARQIYYKECEPDYYDQRNKITRNISYHKSKGNTAKVQELREKQKQIANKFKRFLDIARKEFNSKWGIDEKFTQGLINKL